MIFLGNLILKVRFLNLSKSLYVIECDKNLDSGNHGKVTVMKVQNHSTKKLAGLVE